MSLLEGGRGAEKAIGEEEKGQARKKDGTEMDHKEKKKKNLIKID